MPRKLYGSRWVVLFFKCINTKINNVFYRLLFKLIKVAPERNALVLKIKKQFRVRQLTGVSSKRANQQTSLAAPARPHARTPGTRRSFFASDKRRLRLGAENCATPRSDPARSSPHNNAFSRALSRRAASPRRGSARLFVAARRRPTATTTHRWRSGRRSRASTRRTLTHSTSPSRRRDKA